MITRVYIDNFRCFSNFEWEPGQLSLLLGENGTGKSSVIDVIVMIATFVHGRFDANAFSLNENRSAWDKRSVHTFELGLSNADDYFTYKLILRSSEDVKVLSETVHCNGSLLYAREPTQIALYDETGAETVSFPFSGPRSMIRSITEGARKGRIERFLSLIGRIVIFCPDPIAMSNESDGDVRVADADMHDVVGWLFHLGAMSADFSSRLLQDLKEVLPGLQTYSIPPAGLNKRTMQLYFRAGENAGKEDEFSLYFGQLSPGQKMLVAIYAILHGLIGESAIVLIDEPDNYLSAREVQPWVRALEERLLEGTGQVLLISHHPEAVDYLVPEHGHQFYREHNGPARVKRLVWSSDEGLKPSEAVARGWLE